MDGAKIYTLQWREYCRVLDDKNKTRSFTGPFEVNGSAFSIRTILYHLGSKKTIIESEILDEHGNKLESCQDKFFEDALAEAKQRWNRCRTR